MPPFSVLVTNDDGVHAEGLLALVEAIKEEAEVLVLAPDQERSACSHSMTLHLPIRVRELGPNLWSASGTPADCVNLAVNGLFQKTPDLIVSGINLGANLGCDINYSGTVSAAREAALLGLRGMAVSLDSFNSHADWGPAADIARRLAVAILRHGLPKNVFLNVNVPALPAAQIKPVVITRQGRRKYSNRVLEQADQYGRPCYWLGGSNNGGEPIEDSDIMAVSQGHVSVTPLGLDTTCYSSMAELKNIKW